MLDARAPAVARPGGPCPPAWRGFPGRRGSGELRLPLQGRGPDRPQGQEVRRQAQQDQEVRVDLRARIPRPGPPRRPRLRPAARRLVRGQNQRGRLHEGGEKSHRPGPGFLRAPRSQGGVVKVGGRVEAFTLGGRLSADTAVIPIEIANPGLVGLAQWINREFVRREWAGFRLINREQDMGLPGLRTAKLSYQPAGLVKKYDLTL
ncbi:MAG: DUF2156 domain-containing protein [Candidatus Aminicenantes bacterium]|nr:DUF2156 domain-containing protein [Candidatus Aminicenantes bacterium]